ncbi:MAG: hypothetical protein DHS20C18_01130 [Saprospiraceae bacterium]|nr:MAG: hypothetical protein DHS20C18_01130 [Saprospiraceae bacterium]
MIQTFKTNINCKNCKKTVSGFLNELSDLTAWDVDFNSTEKVLTVKGDQIDHKKVIDAVTEAGFDIELLKTN